MYHIYFLYIGINIRVPNSLNPDWAWNFVRPDLDPNCFQMLSARNTGKCIPVLWCSGFTQEQAESRGLFGGYTGDVRFASSSLTNVTVLFLSKILYPLLSAGSWQEIVLTRLKNCWLGHKASTLTNNIQDQKAWEWMLKESNEYQTTRGKRKPIRVNVSFLCLINE